MRRFRDDESGVMVAFSVILMLMMLLVGGIGVDLMQFEMTRTSLQSTLDRAVLAAADLDQELDPQAVVEDYFAKSGMSDYLASVTVDQGLSYKTVSATAQIDMPTQFIHMVGVNSLQAPAAGTAEERVDKVEISLILDVSGSMGSNSRLVNLKVAAKDFIDTIMDSSAEGDVSISIVPYATQVSAGESLLDQFSVTSEHNYSHCIDFDSDAFDQTEMETGGGFEANVYQRSGHFDVFTYSEGSLSMPVCPTAAASQIRPLSIDRTVLKNHINSLSAGGNTSIDIGMKWGTALLDPSLRMPVSNLIGAGEVDAQMMDRPYDYNTSNSLKVVVLMTDGQNTNQYYLEDVYREGNSNVWYHAPTQRYSIKSGSNYYWKHDQSWHSQPYSNWQGGSERLTYPQLFNQASMAWIAQYLYRPIWGSSSAWNTWYYGTNDSYSNYTKNIRLDHICDAAKAEGIIVYTIGFEAPSDGEAVLKSCASSDGHFFDVQGVEISDAFAAIASSISKLRLTQ